MDKQLTLGDIASFEAAFEKDPTNKVRMHAVTANGIGKASTDNSLVRSLPNVFSVDVDCGSVTNQKKSGRCWMFAGLNALRKIVMDKLNVADFAFSQAYLQFFDKLEKANFFMERTLEKADEDIFSRLNVYLLDAGIGDGGHWAMFVNLVRKYGVIPQECMPDTTVSADTNELNALLSDLLSKDCRLLRKAVKEEGIDKARELKEGLLEEFYRVLSIALGTVPTTVTYEYRDKDKKFHRIAGLTPKAFFEQYVGVDLSSYISLTDAPIHGWQKETKYVCDYVNNVEGGEKVTFFNVDRDIIKKAAIRSLEAGVPLWFAADVTESSLRKEGFLATGILDVEDLFGIRLLQDKGERLDFRATFCNHAMTLTGVNIGEDGKPDRWKVENSWGKENGKDGFFVMSDKWFDAEVFQVIVDRRFVDKEIVEKYDAAKEVAVEPFSPMWQF